MKVPSHLEEPSQQAASTKARALKLHTQQLTAGPHVSLLGTEQVSQNHVSKGARALCGFLHAVLWSSLMKERIQSYWFWAALGRERRCLGSKTEQSMLGCWHLLCIFLNKCILNSLLVGRLTQLKQQKKAAMYFCFLKYRWSNGTCQQKQPVKKTSQQRPASLCALLDPFNKVLDRVPAIIPGQDTTPQSVWKLRTKRHYSSIIHNKNSAGKELPWIQS